MCIRDRFTSAPDMVECFLTLVALAEVESKFVLRRSHFPQDIVVSLPLEQSVANFRMAVVSCIVKRGPLAVILRVDVST